ncbi:hypothetical protein HXK64_00005 [Candidatus Gracilibacteria bacterium]|nr:hypothetical protein [Candidatus Gracilibacteria bacterium]
MIEKLDDKSLNKLAEFDNKIIDLDIEIAKKEGRVEYIGKSNYRARCYVCNNYKWYDSLDTGDILLFYRKKPREGWEDKPGVGGWYHAALVYNNKYVFEAPGINYNSKYTKIENLIEKGGYDKIAVAKMGLSKDEKNDMLNYIPRLLNKPYSGSSISTFMSRSVKESMEKFYCSSLVWRAHYSSGRYMDVDGDPYFPFDGVLPREILVDNNVRGNLSYIINWD